MLEFFCISPSLSNTLYAGLDVIPEAYDVTVYDVSVSWHAHMSILKSLLRMRIYLQKITFWKYNSWLM